MLTVILSPPVAQAGDYFGRRWFLILCNLAGLVGAIVVSRAHSVATTMVGFVITGLAFGCQALLNAVVSEILPRRYRPLAQATVAMSSSLGAIIGLVMGGALIRHGDVENYRIFFYVVAGLFAAAAIGSLVAYHPPPRSLQSLTLREKLRGLDWIGSSLFTSFLILFCVALAWTKNPYQWTNVRILAPFLISMMLLAAFGLYEGKFKFDGILDHRLFQHRNFPLAVGIVFSEGATFIAANQYYPYQTGVFTGADQQLAAMHLVVPQASALVMALITGAYSSRVKKIHWPIFFGMSVLCVFNILMCTVTLSTPAVSFWWYGVFAGGGTGIVAPLIFVAAQISTPPELIALASALMIAARSLGGAVVLAITNAILHDQLDHIPTKVAAAVLPLGLPDSSLAPLIGALSAKDYEALAKIPGATQAIVDAGAHALLRCFQTGFRNIWIVATVFAVVATIGAWFSFGFKVMD